MRPAALLTLLVLAFTAAGCKSKCRQLSEKLCDCATNSIEKESCLRSASNDEGRVSVSDEANAQCAQLLPGCDCRAVNTPEGKVACGLAYPKPTPPLQ
ncbi:MAG: hypothetical protein ACT4TC_09835 [Myxococcaceae bacterium]